MNGHAHQTRRKPLRGSGLPIKDTKLRTSIADPRRETPRPDVLMRRLRRTGRG